VEEKQKDSARKPLEAKDLEGRRKDADSHKHLRRKKGAFFGEGTWLPCAQRELRHVFGPSSGEGKAARF